MGKPLDQMEAFSMLGYVLKDKWTIAALEDMGEDILLRKSWRRAWVLQESYHSSQHNFECEVASEWEKTASIKGVDWIKERKWRKSRIMLSTPETAPEESYSTLAKVVMSTRPGSHTATFSCLLPSIQCS
jgi:hypothetical protein